MKIALRTALLIICTASLVACSASSPRIVGHRVIRVERLNAETRERSTKSRIALTNSGLHALCGVRATVFGLADVQEFHSAQAWLPGEVWYLQLASALEGEESGDKFNCRIPILVEISYQAIAKRAINGEKGVPRAEALYAGVGPSCQNMLSEPDWSQAWTIEGGEETVELSGSPTAIPIKSLSKCTRFIETKVTGTSW